MTASDFNTVAPTPGQKLATEPSHGPIKVWLVDDNDGYRETLARCLAQVGGVECQRDFRSAGAAVSALASQAGPDVVLLDIEMRGENGLDAIAPIKSLAPQTRVLMLTTFYDGLDHQRALAEGAEGFLLKRQSPEQLLAEIRKPASLGRRRRRAPNAAARKGARWWKRLSPRKWFAA